MEVTSGEIARGGLASRQRFCAIGLYDKIRLKMSENPEPMRLSFRCSCFVPSLCDGSAKQSLASDLLRSSCEAAHPNNLTRLYHQLDSTHPVILAAFLRTVRIELILLRRQLRPEQSAPTSPPQSPSHTESTPPSSSTRAISHRLSLCLRIHIVRSSTQLDGQKVGDRASCRKGHRSARGIHHR